jgi:glycosyltransferase involved in cell wall biosynthesis
MKVLQIGLEWFPERGGGLDRVFYDCIRHLPNAGIDVNGLVVGSENVWKTSNGRVSAFAHPNDSLWKRWFEVYRHTQRLLDQNHYDIVVSHFALYVLPILPLLKGKELIIHFQGPWALESQIEGNKGLIIQTKKIIESLTYSRGNRFIVLSQAFQNLLHREYGVPLEQIFIIPPGVDDTYFLIKPTQAEAREQLGWSQDRFIILTVRRLVHRMGLESLIQAIDKVRLLHPEVLLMVAGKGPLVHTLQQQIDSLGLNENVKLLGFVPEENLKLAYRAANISIVPTVSLEGFGLIVIESLAAGTPVLGTPVDAIPETLMPLSENLVFEGTSSQQIANAIVEVLSGGRALPSAQECSEYAINNYSWPVIIQKVKKVYLNDISL